jgi:hypothetical protein
MIRDLMATMSNPEAYIPLSRCITRAADELFHFGGNHKTGVYVGTVSDNLTIKLPGDCLSIFSAAKTFFINGEPYCYPLGREKNSMLVDIKKPLNCAQYTDSVASETVYHYGIEYYYYPYYYGEIYGAEQSRFFGLYDYDEALNTLYLLSGYCVNAGDYVAVKYKSTDQGYEHFTMNIAPVIEARALMYYWENADPSKSQMFERRFIDNYKRYKRDVQKLPYEDYVDAITSAYSSRPR